MGRIRTTEHPVVGTVRWQAEQEVSGAPIRLLDDFVNRNIDVVLVPQLKGVEDRRTEDPSDRFNGRVQFFKGAAEQLQAAFAEIEAAGLADRVLSFAGSFAPRLIRRKDGGPTHTPSNHAFGTALDINNEFNPQGKTPLPIGARGSVRELVSIFEKHGFKWGGRFPTPDGMHFEVSRLVEGGTEQIPIDVFLDGAPVDVPALLIEDTTWVGVRALVSLLGGTVPEAGGDPFAVTVNVGGTDHPLQGQLIGGAGFVKFRELIALYGRGFEFDLDRRRLDIT